jgi:DNA polymerase-4
MLRLHDLDAIVEQISIDEAFLDISQKSNPGEQIALALQHRIRSELQLPCSLGVASNKLVAKIANDVGKSAARSTGPPNAITIVSEGQEASFLAPLPVGRLWGVGPKTTARLAELGLQTIGELADYPIAELVSLFGKNGLALSQHAQGIDDSPVVAYREPKSISQETTFVQDVRDEAELRRTLHILSEGTGKHLRSAGLSAVTIKLKFRLADFTTLTRQMTLAVPTDQDHQIYAAALVLFERAWTKGSLVRLIGVGVSGLRTAARQLSLWDKG